MSSSQPPSGWQTNAPDGRIILERPSGDTDRVTCFGASLAEPVVLVADEPLLGTRNGNLPYFEVTLLEGASIVVGLVCKVQNNDGGGAPGRRLNSIGLHSNGDLVSTIVGHECSIPFASPFGMLDTVGIGCMPLSSTQVQVFATHNGRDLGAILQLNFESCPLYPAIAFGDSGCIANVRRIRPFLFEAAHTMFENVTNASRPTNTPLEPLGSPQQNTQGWPQTTFSASDVGRRLSRVFSASPATKSSRLEADILEAKEHIAVLENVLGEQSQQQQDELLKELTVSCRKLLVRHANLVRDATDDESLSQILALNDRIIELLADADRMLELTGGAPPKTVAPETTSSLPSIFGAALNLRTRGSADTVTEMLRMLRSGTSRSQKNALQCLANLVRERLHNDMVVLNGGIHIFVTLVKAESSDGELRKLAARTLAELASWVRVSDEESTNARGAFKAELIEVLKTLETIVDEEPLLVAYAVSNIVLLFANANPMNNITLNELGVPLLFRIIGLDLGLVETQRSSSNRMNDDILREASRVASFCISILVRRSDSAKTIVVNHALCFPILEWLLRINDDELLLNALGIVKGLLTNVSEGDDGFSQGFILARVLQHPSVLVNLCHVSRHAVDGASRQYLLASLSSLVQHISVRNVLFASVGYSQVLEALFALLALVLSSNDSLIKSNEPLLDESGFFNSHFRQQRAGLNVRESQYRAKMSGLKADAAWASSCRRASGVSLAPKSSANNTGSADWKGLNVRSSKLWELSCLTKGIQYTLSFLSEGSHPIDDIPAEYCDQIITLSKMAESVPKESDRDEQDPDNQVFSDILGNTASILVMLAKEFRTVDPSIIANGLLNLMKMDNSTAVTRILSAMTETVCISPRVALELLKSNCASILCDGRLVRSEHLMMAATTLAELSKLIFEEPRPLTSSLRCYHGYGPHEPVIRFLLGAIEHFDAHPSCATEVCRALTIACSGKSALSTHYRCTVLKRVLVPLSLMSMQCESLEGQRAAEELLKTCGFSQGAMQVVANDAIAIGEWGSMKVDVDVVQVLVELIVAHQLQRGWGERPSSYRGVRSVPFFENRIDGLRILLLETQGSNRSDFATPRRGSVPDVTIELLGSTPSSSSRTSHISQIPPREPGDEPLPFSVGSMPHKILSSMSDFKRPKRLFEAVVGQAEVLGERIVREVSMADSTVGAAAASILRAITRSTPSNKALMDYQIICVEAARLLRCEATQSADSLGGAEHSLDPILHELLRASFDCINSLVRYLSISPVGFLCDERPPSGTHVSVADMQHQPWRTLRLHTNINHWTGKLLERVIGEQIIASKNSTSCNYWSLVLPGNALGTSDDEKDRLVDILYSCPSITSLAFTGKYPGVMATVTNQELASNRVSSNASSQGSADSPHSVEYASRTSSLWSESRLEDAGNPSKPTMVPRPETSREQEEKLAQFLVNMPGSVVWLGLDSNAVSAEGLRLIAAFLGLNANLLGCSVTNSSYTYEDMSDFVRYMARSAMSSTLRYVDLSGNTNLGDAGTAAVIRAFQNTKIVALDLCGTRLDGGSKTIDALLGVNTTPATASRDAKGEARLAQEGLIASSGLKYLRLAQCNLSSESASRLLFALSKHGNSSDEGSSALRVLDLDKNGLRNLCQPLLSLLAFDMSIRELGFLDNEIHPFLGDIAHALKGNKNLQVFRYSTTGSGGASRVSRFSSATVRGVQHDNVYAAVIEIEEILKQNRTAWLEMRRANLGNSLPPPSPRHLSDGEEEQLLQSMQQLHVAAEAVPVFMHMLFASPLVYRDALGRLHPADVLDHDAEKQTLLTCLKESRDRGGAIELELEFDHGCTTDMVISVLTRKPAILHFSTHGEESYIAMEDGRGGLYPLGVQHLEGMLRTANAAASLKLVFISACNSLTVAKAFLAAGVPCVVAVDSNIADKAAQVFTRAFYLSLTLGDPIEAAFNIAKEAVQFSPMLNDSAQSSGKNFVLMGKGTHSLFPPPKKQLIARPAPFRSLREDFPDRKKWRLSDLKFLEVLVPSRNVDVYLTIIALNSKRVVTMQAPEGYGKSAVLSGFMCRYLNERRMFEDGCVVLDLTGCKTVAQVQGRLNRLVRKPYLQHQSSSTDGPQYSDNRTLETEEEFERTVAELAKRRSVLILDHVDQVLDESSEDLRFFLGSLLDQTKGLRLVIAARGDKPLSIPGHEHLALSLRPLNFLDSARLFLKCCPHYHNDVHVRPRLGLPPPENFDQGLARHPLCAQMNGVAKTIVQTAISISYEQWLEVVEEVTEALMCPPFSSPNSPKPGA